jgi:hypothetical protein
VADFFNAPVLDEVDLSAYNGGSEDPIIIRAHDDFKVERLTVRINDPDGVELESGEAVETPPASGRWAYTTVEDLPQGSPVRIIVTVSDQPGGSSEATYEKTL